MLQNKLKKLYLYHKLSNKSYILLNYVINIYYDLNSILKNKVFKKYKCNH